MEITEEQATIIDAVETRDILVNAVAGAGKTTTNLYIAQRYPDKQILLITYNSKLRLETRARVAQLGIRNLTAHTYHSFCVKYYDRQCYTDQRMFNIIKPDTNPIERYDYDMVVIDEAQDITPLYFRLIRKILRPENRLLIFGDVRQSIYDYNGADIRFMTLADELFGRNFLKLSLTLSFRLNTQMADFINNVLFDHEFIRGVDKPGTSAPIYYINNPFRSILKELLPIKNPESIFIIAPTLKGEKSPVRKLANAMTKKGIPVYVPISDEEKLDSDVLKGKVGFSTIHQTKGLERDTVVLFGFDDGYFKYIKKDYNPYKCPNELYVACTRAKKKLILIHSNQADYLPFINQTILNNYCDVRIKNRIRLKNNDESFKLTATQLVKHLSSELIHELMGFISQDIIDTGEAPVPIPIKIQQGYLFESVSEISGTAIPLYYDYSWNDVGSELVKIYDALDWEFPEDGVISVEDVLRASNEWCAFKSGYTFKTKQIRDYNWISDDYMDCCMDHIHYHIKHDAVFEHKFEKRSHCRNIVGYVDCIYEDRIWEFKCVSELQPEHILQTLVYCWLSDNYNPCRLMNILTREVLEIRCDDIDSVVNKLIEYKLSSVSKKSDWEFIREFAFEPI